MSFYALDGIAPELDESAYVAPGARLIGAVRLAAEASVWFNAVLRGDNEPIVVGPGTNIQDGCVLHTDPGFPLTLGQRVTVGHNAVVHGCTIGDGTLVGMGATVMNGARVGRGCLIGAGALVPEGREIPDGSLVLGAPGKVARTLDEAAREGLLGAAQVYIDRARLYREALSSA